MGWGKGYKYPYGTFGTHEKVTLGTVSKLHDRNANSNTDDTHNDCDETFPMTRQRQSKILDWPISLVFCPSLPFRRQWFVWSPSAKTLSKNSGFKQSATHVSETKSVSERATVESDWVCKRSRSRICEVRTLPSTP